MHPAIPPERSRWDAVSYLGVPVQIVVAFVAELGL